MFFYKLFQAIFQHLEYQLTNSYESFLCATIIGFLDHLYRKILLTNKAGVPHLPPPILVSYANLNLISLNFVQWLEEMHKLLELKILNGRWFHLPKWKPNFYAIDEKCILAMLG